MAYILVFLFVACFVYFRMKELSRRPHVTNRQAYRQIVEEITLDDGPASYENPDNYARTRGKLVATSPQLIAAEKKRQSALKNTIPWCFPSIFANLEMRGAFPTIKACRLEVFCRTMVANIDVLRQEYNQHKTLFESNSENLSYANHYGDVDVNKGEDQFLKTRQILGASGHYARTQSFNKLARQNFMSTSFTVLYPGGRIRPHCGPTNYRYRIHMCLDIDGIGGIITPFGTRLWKVGEIFILDDSYLHAGFYDGTRPRVILMVDIAKPGLTPEHVSHMFEDTHSFE